MLTAYNLVSPIWLRTRIFDCVASSGYSTECQPVPCHRARDQTGKHQRPRDTQFVSHHYWHCGHRTYHGENAVAHPFLKKGMNRGFQRLRGLRESKFVSVTKSDWPSCTPLAWMAASRSCCRSAQHSTSRMVREEALFSDATTYQLPSREAGSTSTSRNSPSRRGSPRWPSPPVYPARRRL